MNTDIMMELKKMMGKVIKLTTTEDKKGQSQVMVFTIGANVAPEQFFANMRISWASSIASAPSGI